jgi:DNA-binding beta-propeller fold protein YncE
MTSSRSRLSWTTRTAGAVLVAGGLLLAGDRTPMPSAAPMVGTLVAYEPLPPDVCMMPAAEQRAAMRTAYQAGAAGPRRYADPTRKIKDPYPSFASVAVDVERDEVVFTDESLFSVLVYNRLENTPAGAEASKPKRQIEGENTNIEFQSSVYIDPKTGEIFAVNNDTRDTTVVFGRDSNGDARPVRQISTPHGTFGIAVSEAHNEVILTTQHDSALVSYRKLADGDEAPIRMLQGDKTKLADPHGIAYDPKNDVIFTSNFGSRHDVSKNQTARAGVPSAGNDEGKPNWPLGREWSIPGSGTISPPSIVVHRRTASGNAEPLRVIEGPLTQLDWPTGLAFNPERQELYVANDMGPSILVFDGNATGNVAPKRVLKGPKTGLANPTGVALDFKNNELWVANFGGHTGTVYDMMAANDTAPKRTIRNAPPGSPSLMIGNPGAVAYDPKREVILVPN